MSALRGVQPEEVEGRFKALFYGKPGTGKTTCSLQFPKPYYIDCEGGADKKAYTKLLKEQGGLYYRTQDFDDLYNEIRTLANEKHEFKTVIIDPITYVYSELVESCADRLSEGGKKGEANGRHWALANRMIKKLVTLLLKLDMNVIVTAHSKNEYAGDMAVIGQTFDGYKKLDYMFDLVIETSKTLSGQYVGHVVKSRVEPFSSISKFDFSFKEIERLVGAEVLGKEAIPLELISDETYNQLMVSLESPEIQRVLKLKGIEEMSDLTEEQAQKWLQKAKGAACSS